MKTTERFVIMKASAGSGKTFQLVRYYLYMALNKPKEPGYYKHILAITFTTAAVKEMKERVMKRLSEFAAGNGDKHLEPELLKMLKISPEELRERATAVYNHMLHHYRDLSIITIDSLTHRLVRAFAKDLRLSADFSIEMNEPLFKEKMIDRLLDELGINRPLTEYMKEYSLDKIEDGTSWNPRGNLLSIATELLKEAGVEPLEQLTKIDLSIFKEVRFKIRQEHKAFQTKMTGLADQVFFLLEKGNLTEDDLPYKKAGWISFVKKLKNKEYEPKVSSRFADALDKDKWVNEHAHSRFQPIATEIRGVLECIRKELEGESLTRYHLLDQIQRNIAQLGLSEYMAKSAELLKAEENTLLLSDFHKLVNNVIKDNDAPFIYERIGNRYKHILIDEFQDTSKTQWKNLIPLVQNSLSEGNHCLVVGDAKQSIYRWRASYVKQFTDLPQVPEEFNNPLASRTFTENRFFYPLTENFRSSQSVVAFNNAFYAAFAPLLKEHQHVYAGLEQTAQSKQTGYVKLLNEPEKEKKKRKQEEPETELESSTDEPDSWKTQLLECIEECQQDQFPLGEITILVRTGKEGAKCAEWLQENHISSTTNDSFLLKRSIHVRALMGFLEYSEFPEHHFAGFDCVQALSEIHPGISIESFVNNHIKRDKKKVVIDLFGFLNNHFGDVSSVHQSESVFSLAVSVIRKLKLQSDSGVEFLLNHIKQECIQHNLNLAQFIQWWKEKKNTLKIMTAAHPGSVNIMTIHKSKGLEFPAVIVPMFYTKNKTNQLWIDLDDDVFGLPVGLVSASPISTKSEKENNRVKHPKIEPEAYNMLLDDTNTLYVATTRAAQRLYFIYGGGGTYFNNSVQQTIGQLYPEFAVNNVCTLGERQPFAEHNKEATNHMAHPAGLRGESSLLPRLKVIPAKHRDTPFMAYGKLLHEALSYLDTSVTATAAIHRAVKGSITQDEVVIQQLHEDIEAIRQHPELAKWYGSAGIVINERELCSTTGDIIRPDRVVELDDHIVVIDYKTGAKSDRHMQQVAGYKHQLNVLYNKPAKGYLVYTKPLEILEV
jgi:ATP-dependent exoDNAse (exonuclease V) beta subunit